MPLCRDPDLAPQGSGDRVAALHSRPSLSRDRQAIADPDHHRQGDLLPGLYEVAHHPFSTAREFHGVLTRKLSLEE